MVEGLFSTLTIALSSKFYIALIAAFSWGILSILLSPCHLSGIPLVIGYIVGQKPDKARNSFYLAFVFSVGILITIALIGIITALTGRLMGDVGVWGNLLVATVFIFMGLYLMDIIKWNWTGLTIENSQRNGVMGAFILGLIFGIGLGPCTFAFLAPVLGLAFQIASENWLKALSLIFAFGIGHCAVIVLVGSLTHIVQKYLNWTEKSKISRYFKRFAGFLVFIGGIYFIYLIFV